MNKRTNTKKVRVKTHNRIGSSMFFKGSFIEIMKLLGFIRSDDVMAQAFQKEEYQKSIIQKP